MIDLQQLSQYQTPQTPEPAPIAPPPRHRWGLLGVFFVFALALAAVAYFFLSEKYAAEPVIPTYTPRDISSLKTYRNTEEGFEFSYPGNFYLTTQGGIYAENEQPIVEELNQNINQFTAQWIRVGAGGDANPTEARKLSNTPVDTTFRDVTPQGNKSNEQIFEKIISINSQKINLSVVFDYPQDDQNPTFNLTAIFYNKNNEPVFIGLDKVGTTPEEVMSSPLMNTFLQILSTFKFITPIKSSLQSIDSTWNLYTNETLGFTIKVPKLLYGNEKVNIIETENSAQLGVLPSWNIRVGKVQDQNALAQFVKSLPYWSQCGIESITPIAGQNYSAVNLKRTDPEGGCFTNYIYAIFYSSTLQKAASWLGGQSCNFRGPTENACYDEEMVKSFKFTK